MAEETKRKRRVLNGTVRSDKMEKTVVVEVTHRVLHHAYHKYIMRRGRYKAHDEQKQCHIGDKGQISESRPLSRDKRLRVQKVIEQAK